MVKLRGCGGKREALCTKQTHVADSVSDGPAARSADKVRTRLPGNIAVAGRLLT